MTVENLEVKFEKLYKNLSQKSFLDMSALGGEIPFYIVPYHPEQENSIVERVKRLKSRLSMNGITVFEIDLYDLALEMFEDRGLLEKIIEKEKTLSKDKLFKTLQGVLDSETRLVPKIEELSKQNSSHILFLTGIGKVYPFIRSHAVLNNLQNSIKDRPTVMFFPGTYKKELSLFGRIKDDNYYRAFNLDTLNL